MSETDALNLLLKAVLFSLFTFFVGYCVGHHRGYEARTEFEKLLKGGKP